MLELFSSIGSRRGIGPNKEKIFNAQGLMTVEDLINYFPRSYQDRRLITRISDLKPGEEALITAKVLTKKAPTNYYRKNSPLSLLVGDDTGAIEVVFFNGRFLSKLFDQNVEYTFYGKVSQNYARFQMIHPEFSRTGAPDDIRGIIPIYPKINGVSQKEIRRIEQELSPLYDDIPEWIPGKVVKDYRLADIKFALSNLHFPTDGKKVLAAKFRMVFSELLVMETGLQFMRKGEQDIRDAIVISGDGGDSLMKDLPFELTEDQLKAWKSIRDDLESSKRMNRLLQGDVGSGKTVIAEMAMLSSVRSGYQSVIMAPTEILAKQHLETFSRDFKKYGITPKLLISSMPAKEKKEILQGLKDGSVEILIATHAVLQENVKFDKLGLVVTDEQHRFGVNQRRKLSEKGEGVNVLVMTATPIPRTLAVILYGDLDSSQIRSMPKGRKPVKTTHTSSEGRERVYEFARGKIKEGRQIYVVAPLIDDSDSIDAHSAKKLFEELQSKFKGFRVQLVHGAMKQDEKDLVMQDFSEGLVDVLVSTVVIEVGINVPNASVMIIENAERFGLAQLHQLRGRVGRGSEESFCFLISDSDSEVAVKRQEIMCSTNDGFEIAERDMELRGPGEIFGTKQHGIPELILSDLVKHIDVLEKAQIAAKEILESDPALKDEENRALRAKVENTFGEDLSLLL